MSRLLAAVAGVCVLFGLLGVAAASTPSLPDAADGTPATLPDGSPNPEYFLPPKAYRSPEGFQKARWGMAPTEVRKLYPKVTPAGDHALMLRGRTAGLETDTYFVFVDDRLTTVSVQSRATHMAASQYVEDFNNLKDILLKQYGAPDKEREEWKESLLKDQEGGLPAALALGHVELATTWSTRETAIILTATGDNGRVDVKVQYLGMRLSLLMQQRIDQTDASELAVNSDNTRASHTPAAKSAVAKGRRPGILAPDVGGYMGMRWGASYDDAVRVLPDLKPIEGQAAMWARPSTVVGMDARTEVQLRNEKLAVIRNVIRCSPSYRVSCNEARGLLVAALTKKYGEPFALGRLILGQWQNESTVIRVKQDEESVQVEYLSRALMAPPERVSGDSP